MKKMEQCDKCDDKHEVGSTIAWMHTLLDPDDVQRSEYRAIHDNLFEALDSHYTEEDPSVKDAVGILDAVHRGRDGPAQGAAAGDGMKVYVVVKTNGIYNDDVTVVGVYGSSAPAEKDAEAERKEMRAEVHSDFGGYEGDPADCEACEEYETGGHYVEVHETEVQQ